MLGIDRINLRRRLGKHAVYHFAGDHKCFLVGEGYILACLYGADGRLQAAVAHGRRQNGVDIVGLDAFGKSLVACTALNAKRRKGSLDTGQELRTPYDNTPWTMRDGGFDKFVGPTACGEHNGAIALGMRCYYIKSLAADRTGSTKNGYILNCVFHKM